MNDLKKIIKHGLVTVSVIFIIGIVTQNIYMYLGMFLGSLLSIIGFYMLCLDAKSSVVSNSPFKVGVLGYLKRYVLYGLFLAISTKYFGFPMLIAGVIGLLNIKFNILALTFFRNLKKFNDKYLK